MLTTANATKWFDKDEVLKHSPKSNIDENTLMHCLVARC